MGWVAMRDVNTGRSGVASPTGSVLTRRSAVVGSAVRAVRARRKSGGLGKHPHATRARCDKNLPGARLARSRRVYAGGGAGGSSCDHPAHRSQLVPTSMNLRAFGPHFLRVWGSIHVVGRSHTGKISHPAFQPAPPAVGGAYPIGGPPPHRNTQEAGDPLIGTVKSTGRVSVAVIAMSGAPP